MTNDVGGTSEGQAAQFDTGVPHSARIWNYWLGGKDNFAADRGVGEHVKQIFPGIVRAARAQRDFLARAVRYLAAEAQVRQFLDVGVTKHLVKAVEDADWAAVLGRQLG